MSPVVARTIAVVALALAIVASVFAIWPVVADAPWEDERVVEIVRDVPGDTDDPRCIAAETILSKYAELQGQIRALRPLEPPEPLQPLEPLRSLGALRPEEILEELVEQAERDMERYC